MAERHTLCLFISLLLFELGQGLKREGPKLRNILPTEYKEPCVSILATDLAPYKGKLCMYYAMLKTFSCFQRLSEIGTSTLRCQNAKELLKLEGNPLFQSLLASISCLVTIAETDDDRELLKLLEFMGDLSVAKKYMFLIVSTFDSTKFLNVTINFQAIVHQKETGLIILKMSAKIKDMLFLTRGD